MYVPSKSVKKVVFTDLKEGFRLSFLIAEMYIIHTFILELKLTYNKECFCNTKRIFHFTKICICNSKKNNL